LIKVLICQLVIITNLTFVHGQDQSSEQIIQDKLIKRAILEFGITPRAVSQNDTKVSHLDSNHYSFNEGIIRLQLGIRLVGNHHFHFCYDYFFRRLSDNFPFHEYSDYNGTGLSIQYNYKWIQSSDLKKITFSGRRINYGIIPESVISFGLTNLRSGYEYSSVRSSNKWFPYWSLGTGIGFRPSRFFELIMLYQMEYYPSIKSYPFRNIPQIKFNFRI